MNTPLSATTAALLCSQVVETSFSAHHISAHNSHSRIPSNFQSMLFRENVRTAASKTVGVARSEAVRQNLKFADTLNRDSFAILFHSCSTHASVRTLLSSAGMEEWGQSVISSSSSSSVATPLMPSGVLTALGRALTSSTMKDDAFDLEEAFAATDDDLMGNTIQTLVEATKHLLGASWEEAMRRALGTPVRPYDLSLMMASTRKGCWMEMLPFVIALLDFYGIDYDAALLPDVMKDKGLLHHPEQAAFLYLLGSLSKDSLTVDEIIEHCDAVMETFPLLSSPEWRSMLGNWPVRLTGGDNGLNVVLNAFEDAVSLTPTTIYSEEEVRSAISSRLLSSSLESMGDFIPNRLHEGHPGEKKAHLFLLMMKTFNPNIDGLRHDDILRCAMEWQHYGSIFGGEQLALLESSSV